MARQIILSACEHFQRENDKPGSVNFQLKSWSGKQKASITALKESLISCSHTAATAENQTQNLILWVVKLK